VLRPSYSELIDIVNNDKSADSEITSRYTIVLAVAKRARQIIEGAGSVVSVPTDRAVSTAVKELAGGKLRIKLEKEDADIYAERATQQYYKGFSAVSKDDLREDFKDKYEPDKISGADDLDLDLDADEDEEDDYRDEDYADEDDHIDDEESIALDEVYEDVPLDDDYPEDFDDFEDEE